MRDSTHRTLLEKLDLLEAALDCIDAGNEQPSDHPASVGARSAREALQSLREILVPSDAP